MNVRSLMLAAAGAVGLLAAAWQVVVPALMGADAARLPPLGATAACAAGAMGAALAWVLLRARDGRTPAELPAQAAAATALAGTAAALALFGQLAPGDASLRACEAASAAGFSWALAPAAGAAVRRFAPPRATHGRPLRLTTLVTGHLVLTVAGAWAVFAPSVVLHAAPGPARATFVAGVLALAATALGAGVVLAWGLARRVARDLRDVAVAVEALDVDATPDATPDAAPDAAPDRAPDAAPRAAPAEPRPVVAAAADEVADLIAAVQRLRERLEREREAHDEALSRSQRADAAREEFLRVVSHELRTPLNAICGYAQLLIEGLDGPMSPDAIEDAQSILDSGRQLSALVDDVVDLAMLASLRPGLKLGSVDVAALVKEVARTHASLTRGRTLELRVEVAPDLPVAQADRKRLRQVLTNLVANAIKFTDEGWVQVSARVAPDRPDHLQLEVADTGVGIAPHELAGLFDEFRQGSNIGSKRQKGAGLGLAICRRLVELHGGTISAESRPGEGARFRVLLPLAGPPAPPASSGASGRATTAPPAGAGGEAAA